MWRQRQSNNDNGDYSANSASKSQSQYSRGTNQQSDSTGQYQQVRNNGYLAQNIPNNPYEEPEGQQSAENRVDHQGREPYRDQGQKGALSKSQIGQPQVPELGERQKADSMLQNYKFAQIDTIDSFLTKESKVVAVPEDQQFVKMAENSQQVQELRQSLAQVQIKTHPNIHNIEDLESTNKAGLDTVAHLIPEREIESIKPAQTYIVASPKTSQTKVIDPSSRDTNVTENSALQEKKVADRPVAGTG